MTALERRCRMLLRAYPAGYRQERGEEIIDTLLEATPPRRSWPLARDACALVMAGLRARAALNRRLTTAAKLRTAALTGATAYLAYTAASDVSWFIAVGAAPAARYHQAIWVLLSGMLVGIAVAMAWLSSRKTVVLAATIAAGVAVALAGYWPRGFAVITTELACLAALALHAGRDERPGRRWLWLLALVAVVPMVGYLLPGSEVTLFLALQEALAIVSLLWLFIDARPAVAMSVFGVALWLPPGIANVVAGVDIGAEVPLLIMIPLAVVAMWQLHRQSARATAGRES